MKRTQPILMLLIVSAFMLLLPAYAQESDVYVTTQDYTSFRVGPGFAFERTAIIPPATTLRAVGRTYDNRWIQVEYNGERGWLAAWLLVWSGDLIGLPLDGIDPASFARQAGLVIDLSADIAIYSHRELGIGARVEQPISCTTVELTGRLGRGLNMWLQFWCAGNYYWVGSYYFTDNPAIYSQLPVAFVYTYGRLIEELQLNYELAQNSLSAINNIWSALTTGQAVSCNFIPEDVPALRISDEDIAAEAEFAAAVDAQREAGRQTNLAIQLFRDVCAQQDTQPLIEPDTVTQAQAAITEANSNIFFVSNFFPPLANRDPLIGGGGIEVLPTATPGI
jgi:hypothetical protein